MAKVLLLAWSSPVSAERAAEFEEWTIHTHIPQVCAAVPAITAVARYQLADPEPPGSAPRYLTIYELDDADVPAAAAALAGSAAAGRIEMTAAMDLSGNPPQAQWYRGLPG